MNPNNGVVWNYVKQHPLKILSVIISITLIYGSIQWTIADNTEDIRGNFLNILDIRNEQEKLKLNEVRTHTKLEGMDKKIDQILSEIREMRK